MGEGEALHHVGCSTKALNLIWFRGGGDLGDYFRASGGQGGFLGLRYVCGGAFH